MCDSSKSSGIPFRQQIMSSRLHAIDFARWAVYGLLSSLAIAIGSVFLAMQKDEIGISLLAAGLSSLLFLVQKVVDDLAANDDRQDQVRALNALNERIGTTLTPTRIEAAVGAAYARLGAGADTRVTFSRHLSNESMATLRDLPDDAPVTIDAIGISLKQLFVDHEAALLERRDILARLILLDPNCPEFDKQVRHEGRDAMVMRKQITYVTEAARAVNEQRSQKGWGPSVDLRLFDGIMTVTGMRLNDSWYFRPRLANESNSFQFFFERYDTSAPQCFKVVSSHFDVLWGDAHASGTQDESQSPDV